MFYIIFFHYYSYLWNLKKMQIRQIYLLSWEKKGDIEARTLKLNNGHTAEEVSTPSFSWRKKTGIT